MALAVKRAVFNPPRFLLVPWLRRIGLVSYGMYVFHELGNQIAAPHIAHLLAGSDAAIRIPLKLLYIPTMTTLTYAVAWTSYRFIEGRSTN